MHIIDADKLLEVIDAGMVHSKLCSEHEPVTFEGNYDIVSDVISHLDLYTYNQIKVIREYVIKNMI